MRFVSESALTLKPCQRDSFCMAGQLEIERKFFSSSDSLPDGDGAPLLKSFKGISRWPGRIWGFGCDVQVHSISLQSKAVMGAAVWRRKSKFQKPSFVHSG